MTIDLMSRAERRRTDAVASLDLDRRGEFGQFFTPAPLANLLASFFDLRSLPNTVRLLDPGAGTGSLSAAFVARIASESPERQVHISAYEIDGRLSAPLAETLADCGQVLGDSSAEQHEQDFVAWACNQLGILATSRHEFDCVIMNPPYRKIHSQSRERALLRGIGIETTNLYTAFLALALRLLRPGGQLVAITPRSFCNGTYFRWFRRDFTSHMGLKRIHVLGSRNTAFKDAEVLQENVIVQAMRGGPATDVLVTSSDGFEDDMHQERVVPYDEVVSPDDPERFIHVVPDLLGASVLARMAQIHASLDHLRLKVSTGRVVDFRMREHLRSEPAEATAPLIYPGHIADHFVRWPAGANRKPKAIAINDETEGLLHPVGHYVVVKRFTSKEERRRVVAAVHDPFLVPSQKVAFENHLNVFHRDGVGLDGNLARGLSAFLNSTIVDLFLRLFNGHTQVNATDLRSLRYPTSGQLLSLGEAIGDAILDQDKLDALVQDHVPELASLPGEVDPLAVHRRVAEGIEILRELGLPRQQQNERSALTLLALLDLGPDDDWADASAPLRGITQMMDFFAEKYGKRYAPNTRETVRRQTVHQFVAAALVVPNPDKPDRPVNSGKTVYQMEPDALRVIASYGSSRWKRNIKSYQKTVKSLQERWAAERKMKRIPVTLPEGTEVTLSPGGQNVLIVEIIEGFCSRFTPGGEILYIGDADEKFAVYEQDRLASLGVSIEEHGKMPDLVVHDRGREWLVLIEAVTSHGPMNPKRREELGELFASARPGLIYVTAFLDRKTLAKYIDDISWETEVWVAENPTHLIHFDGERYLGPYET